MMDASRPRCRMFLARVTCLLKTFPLVTFAPHDGIVDGPLEYVPVLRTRLPWQSDASAVDDLEARKSGIDQTHLLELDH